MVTICFTGHRPNKLGGYNWSNPKNKEIREKIKDTIDDIIDDCIKCCRNDFHFITGGAIGVDQMAFDVVNDIKQLCNIGQCLDIYISQEVAVPFKQQHTKWSSIDANRYECQLYLADKVTYVDRLEKYKINGVKEDIYDIRKMQLRNMYMVDNSDIVIAVWNGVKKGGTWNCIKYAKSLGKEIIYINV